MFAPQQHGWMVHHQPQQLRPIFESEPPSDLRKSNFFHFRVELRMEGGAPIDVQDARFVQFLNEDKPRECPLRNGIKYAITLKYPNVDLTERRDLFLTLVDSNTQEPIRYEGHDDNPKMQRVLLTHEAICTRCSLNKSCGNKNEAPSDPTISGRNILKFFLRCNQNCLKGAGNPRDTRRFSLAVSLGDSRGVVALSRPMFVHNNSKHSRNKRKREGPRIAQLVGPSVEGQLVVVGENFREGDTIFVNNEPVGTMVRSERVIEVFLPPPSSIAPTFRVAVQSGDHFLEAEPVRNPPDQPLACISRSNGSFVFVSPRWAAQGVSFAWGQSKLPILSIVPGHAVKVAEPRGLVPEEFMIQICVFWNDRPVFSFPYSMLEGAQILEQDPGCIILHRHRPGNTCQMFQTLDRRNSVVFVEEVDSKPCHCTYSHGGYCDPFHSFSSSSSSDSAAHHSPPIL